MIEYTSEQQAELRKDATFIAEKLGLDRSTICKVIRGNRANFSPITIRRIDDACKLRLSQNLVFKKIFKK